MFYLFYISMEGTHSKLVKKFKHIFNQKNNHCKNPKTKVNKI